MTLLMSPALMQSVFAANSLGFDDESQHYVVIGQISFDGTAPVAGKFVTIDLDFKPIPASYWNDTVTVLNFTITHERCSSGACKNFQDFNAGMALNTGSGVSSWTYTTHQYYPPTPYPISVSHTGPGGPWYFKPNDSGPYQTTAVIKLTKPPLPSETYKFSFETVNQTSSSSISTTFTISLISTKTTTTTSTEPAIVAQSQAYLLASAILTVALVGTIIWAMFGKRKR